MNRTLMLSLLLFLLLSAAAVLLLRPDRDLLAWLRGQVKRRDKINSFKKQSRLRKTIHRLIDKCVSLISESQLPKGAYFLLTGLCSAGGFFVGKLVFSSTVIAGAVSAFGLVAPLLLFSFRKTKADTVRLERLASSMLIVSNAYIISEDIIAAVRENIEILEYPEPFRDFLTYVTLMDSSISAGLRRMEQQVGNAYCSQWIDVLDLSQQDRKLKYATVGVVESLHDLLSVQAESNAAMYAVWRDYLMTLVMIFSVPLIFRMALPDAYLTMTTSTVGQLMFLLLLTAVVFSVLRALKINKPLML